MKLKRHEAILEIIAGDSVETQEELIGKLRDSGFEVTQATVSRDIRELKLTKVMTDSGIYKYSAPQSGDTVKESSEAHKKVMSASIKSIDYAGNSIVIKTYPGMANAFAVSLDSLTDPDILGCVAGDDTIIIVARSDEAAAEISEKIGTMY